MLQVQNLHKSYGPATVLAGASLIVNDGEHVGLIGPNGAGKSTLLRCLIDQEQPDSGSIVRTPPGLSIGYLAQAFDAMGGATLGQVVAAAQADLSAAERALQQAADTLASATDMDAALAAYDAALAHFEALGGYEREQRATAVLQGLGLGGIDPATPATTLSGGQKTRLGLATLLLREPRLLLLDEPTNHLDVAALEWLESFVQGYPHAALIVSHDREFLDQTVTRILYLDPNTRTIKSYAGNYSDFAAAREQERAAQQAAWQDQQFYIQQVEADIRRARGLAMNIQNGPKRHRDHYGRISAKVARLAQSRERKLERYLDNEERVERPRGSWSLKLDFGEPPPSGRAVLRVEDISFSYERPSETGEFEGAAPSRSSSHQGSPATEKGEFEGAAPSRSPSRQGSHLEIDNSNDQSLISHLQSPLLSDVSFEVAYGERVALVGPNGAGKTTLLRLIEGRLQPQTGSIRLGTNVRVGRLAQEHETLDLDRTVLETVLRERPMSETEARSFLHFFLFGGDSVFRRVGACSLGERSRLQLALLVLRGCNLLLLDEPLNHLDIDGREHFAAALDAFEGTVIAVAHDRAFLRAFAERVIEVRAGHARVFAGDYEYYLAKRKT